MRFDNNEFGLEWRRGPRQSVDFGSDLALAYIDLKRDCIFLLSLKTLQLEAIIFFTVSINIQLRRH